MFKSVNINVQETLSGYVVAISHEGLAPVVETLYSQQEIESWISQELSHALRNGFTKPVFDTIGNVLPMNGVAVTRPIDASDVPTDMLMVDDITGPTEESFDSFFAAHLEERKGAQPVAIGESTPMMAEQFATTQARGEAMIQRLKEMK